MTRHVLLALTAVALVGFVAGPAAAQKAPKINPTVEFARTWEAAVEEAKLLNVPIVVHDHGFY
ncbi:MAG: hypothetical protein R3F20_19115 [Planctomycetota bacterium]